MTATDGFRLVTRIALRRDATLEITDDGIVLAGENVTARLTAVDAPVAAALKRLAAGPATAAELPPIAGMQAMLQRTLDGGGWLEHGVSVASSGGETLLAQLRPLGFGAVRVATSAPTVPRLLSRFAVARPDGAGLLVETPLSTHAVELLAPPAVALLGTLVGTGAGVDEAAATVGLPANAVAAVFDLLAAAGLVRSGDGPDAETDELRLAQWSSTELLMHATSRVGRRSAGYGGTYRLRGSFAPVPTMPVVEAGEAVEAEASTEAPERIVLTKPDLTAAAANDPPLTTVIETRRSVREHDDDRPITVDQVSELLYRTLRIRQTGTAGDDTLVDRPVPAGGSLGELGAYVIASNCEGLAAGVWRYVAHEHVLQRVAEPTPASAELIAYARAGSLMSSDPQVLLALTARFGRVMWKYESMAYALILKHVGVAYQTLYLVAHAMGLAPCALGGGNADLFAVATGLDYYTEGSVGEFIVGSRPAAPVIEWESSS